MPPRRHDEIGDASRYVVRVVGQGRPARRRRAKHDLVLIERRRLEHDRRAVRERPLGDPGAGADGGLRDGAGRGRCVDQGPRAHGVDIGREGLARRRLEDGRKLGVVRCRVTPDCSGAVTMTSRFRSGNHSLASALTSLKVMSGRNRRWNASSCQIVGRASPSRKIRAVLVGTAVGVAVRTLGDHPLVRQHHRLLCARQLGFGEAEARHALELERERVEPAGDAVVRDKRLQDGLVLGPGGREQRAIRGRLDKRRRRALARLVEPRVEHVGEQLIEDLTAIAPDRRLIPCREQVADLDGGLRRLFVGDDRVARGRMIRHVIGRPGPLGRRRGKPRGKRREVRLDHALDGGPIEVVAPTAITAIKSGRVPIAIAHQPDRVRHFG